MRTWSKFVRALTREPVGLNADGRRLGLGLATAQDKARQQATAEVEDFLRRRATEHDRSTTRS
ncbi:hypothetical protein SacmaDRAFT_3749 [Saccharomonospora marina XMU15]|uniref:Uncharacterized protein n=1 Tax=Saccharomonospora marina XMU15 TaxID=882083 RepID=H5X0W2_9PSEU|nr:hypothetical protein [Saccharomonospora marina]EHR51962.1 hypothetical protein SacmaDRAFT_3749 [Saccharomonospora marina XMU15]